MNQEGTGIAENSTDGLHGALFYLDELRAPAFAVDASGHVTAWNRRLAESSCLAATHVQGLPLASCLEQKDTRLWEKALRDCWQTAVPVRCSVRIRTGAENGAHKDVLRCDILVVCYGRSDDTGAMCFVEKVEQETAHVETTTHAMKPACANFLPTANIAAFGVDKGGKVTLWNNKLASLSGYSANEVLGKPLVEFSVVSSFCGPFQDILYKAYLGEGTSNYDIKFRTKSGGVRLLLANVSPAKDNRDSVIGAIGVAEDVTESVWNCRSTVSRAGELRQGFETANILIFGVDEAGYVDDWNDRTAEVTGYESDRAIRMPFIDTFIPEEYVESFQTIHENALNGRGAASFYLRMRTKDSKMCHLLVTGTPRRNSEKELCGALFFAHDVTEAWKHDQAVAAMAHELRQLIDRANTPIFGVDVDG